MSAGKQKRYRLRRLQKLCTLCRQPAAVRRFADGRKRVLVTCETHRRVHNKKQITRYYHKRRGAHEQVRQPGPSR